MFKKVLKAIIPFHWRLYIRQKLYPHAYDGDIKRRKEFYSQFIGPRDWVFDVGANFGNRVTAFLALGANVVAVEPQRGCYKFLKLHFGKKIHLVKKGLGAKEEIRKFFIADSSTISTFSQDYINAVKESGRFGESKWEKTEAIEMTTLDKLIDKYGVPNFIKIDVEGFEKEVLSGLTYKIRSLSFEYCVPEQLKEAIECINILSLSNPGMRFNFSSGESMKLDTEKWISASEMVEFVHSNDFIRTAFGDIYGKNFD